MNWFQKLAQVLQKGIHAGIGAQICDLKGLQNLNINVFGAYKGDPAVATDPRAQSPSQTLKTPLTEPQESVSTAVTDKFARNRMNQMAEEI